MGWGNVVSLLRYGDDFRRQRRMIQQHFNTKAVKRFEPIQVAELYTMLDNIIKTPEKFSEHIYRWVIRLITFDSKHAHFDFA